MVMNSLGTERMVLMIFYFVINCDRFRLIRGGQYSKWHR